MVPVLKFCQTYLEDLYTSQFKGAEYKSDIDIQRFFI